MQSPLVNDFPSLFYDLRWWCFDNICMDCSQLLLILSLHMLKLRLQKIDLIYSLWQLLIYAKWSLFLLLIFRIQLLIISHQHLLTLVIALGLLFFLVILLLLLKSRLFLLWGWPITWLCVDCSCVDGNFVYYMVWDECLFDVLCGDYCWHWDRLDDCFVQWPVLYYFCCGVGD